MSPVPHQDAEYMTLQMVAERVQILILYSLCGYLDKCNENGTELDVDQLVKEISDEVYVSKGKTRRYLFQKIYKANRENPTKAFLTNILTFNKIQKYKNALMNQYRAKALKLDAQTLAIWFIADVLNRAFDLHWHFVAAAVLKILFIYDYASAKKVREMLEPLQTHPFFPDDEKLRKWKSKTIDEIQAWFGNDIVKVTEGLVGKKWENHFERPANPQENFELAVECMELQALYRHSCVLDSETELKSESDVVKRLKQQNVSDADGIERMFMHLLSCPHDLFSTLGALGLATDVEQRLGIPLFMLAGNGGGEGHVPQGRRDIIKHYLTRKINIEEELRQRDIRRKNLTLEYVIIAIDDVVRARISLDEPRTLELDLKPGESILAVRGEDSEGSLPLEVRQIPWGIQASSARPDRFHTRLKDGRKLKFEIIYQKDGAGGLSGATMRIIYLPRKSFAGAAGFVRRRPGLTTVGAVAAVLAAVMVAAAGFARRRPGLTTVGAVATVLAAVAVAVFILRFPASRSTNQQSAIPNSTSSHVTTPSNASLPNNGIFASKPSGPETPNTWTKEDPKSKGNKAELAQGNGVGRAFAGRRSRRASASSHAAKPTVIVRDTNNQPVPYAYIVFKTARSNHRHINVISTGDVCGISDAKGRFVLTPRNQHTLLFLTPGVYDLIVSKDRFVTARKRGIKVRGTVGRSFYIVLEREP